MTTENQLSKQLVVVSQAALNSNQHFQKVALFGPTGNALIVEQAADTGATVVLTGFVTGAAVTAVAATDTVNEAIAKLQNRIVALENA